MGNLINWTLPPTEAGWTTTYIETSDDQILWGALSNQSINDNTYYDETGGVNTYYRIRFYNSTSHAYSNYSNIIQGSLITTTYCTPEDVQRQLQIDMLGGEGRSKPTRADIIEIIKEAEDDIDKTTGHAWREKTSTEYKTLSNYSLHEKPIYLKHRSIKTFDSTEGDKIEVWNGSEWEDYLTAKTEGRDNDYWIDYEEGIIYINNSITIYPNGVKITYRYGETTIPNDIRKATSLMAAMMILDTNDRTIMVPEGTQFNSYSSRLERMKEKIDEILQNHSEITFINP